MVPERLIEIVAGRRRVSPLATLAIALAVTALVVIPLTSRVRASEEASDPAADAQSVVVQIDGGSPMALDSATVSGQATIMIVDEEATGVSFNLFAAGGSDPVLSAQDLAGPTFSPRNDGDAAAPIDTTVLDNGAYELFVTMTGDAGEQRTAVPFSIENP